MDYAQRLQERMAARRLQLTEATEKQKKAEEILKKQPLRERNPPTATVKIRTEEMTVDKNCTGMKVTVPKVHVVRGLCGEEKENPGLGQESEVLINYKMLHERVEKLREIPYVEDSGPAEMSAGSEAACDENSNAEEIVDKSGIDSQHQRHDDIGDSAENSEDETEDEQEDPDESISEDKTESGEMGAEQEQTDSITSQPPTPGENLMRDTVKDHLQRLGRLYGDANLSSPIHRTESSFNADDEPLAVPQSIKTPTRTRLAALANTINSWEDDLRHHQITKSKEGAAAKQKKIVGGVGEPNKATSRHVTWDANVAGVQNKGVSFKRVVSFGNNCKSDSENKSDGNKSSALPKKMALDSATLESLEEESKTSPPSSQDGRNKALSPACPTTVVGGPSTPCHSPRMGVAAVLTSALHGPGLPSNANTVPEKSVLKSSVAAVCKTTPEKIFGMGSPKMGISSFCNVASSPEKRAGLLSPRSGAVSSPKNKTDVSPGSVLHMAAVFESHSPAKKTVKDPAELPISERLALFERNKGQPPLPKAFVSLAVAKSGTKKQLAATESSIKVLNSGHTSAKISNLEQKQITPDTSSTALRSANVEGGTSSCAPSSKILQQLQKFEHGLTNDSDAVRIAKEERLKELQALQNRWHNNKEVSANAPSGCSDEKCYVQTGDELNAVQSIDEKSEMQKGIEKWHKNKQVERSNEKDHGVKDHKPVPSAPALPVTSHVPPPPLSVHSTDEFQQFKKIASFEKRDVRGVNPERQYPAVRNVKKIKVSPPKPGRLYPCLSDIDATTETETETDAADDECQSLSSEASSIDRDMSFGREIMEAAGLTRLRRNTQKAVSESSNLSEEESAVCDDMDEFLDEALADDSDSDCNAPTPPKKHRVSKSPVNDWNNRESPATSQSHSFEYVRAGSSPRNPSVITSGGNTQVTLTHTISVYRRQQNMKNTPVRQVTRRPDGEQFSHSEQPIPNAKVEADISQRISDLLDEVAKQQTVISQASQALNLCSNTIEFMGSTEQVEGERLLLLATHKRQALMNEIQRLKIEGSVKPKSGSQNNEELFDKGNLTVSHITLPLRRDYLRQMAADNKCHHYVCLLRCQEQVLATPVLAASPENLLAGSSALVFPGHLRMEGLYGDFKAKLEVYTMQTPKEVLPHDVKYHIHKDKKDCGKLRLTPKKLMKQDSKLFMPSVQSPAGPSAVLTSNFQLTGFVVFSLREIKRTHFTLNKVAFSSPLEGSIQMRLSSELTLDVTEHGFLNLYQDVGDYGSLLRRWFVLKGSRLSYWRYPEEEKSMVPLGYIDLNSCITDLVGLVPQSICTRANTFLLEIRRPTLPDDKDSLLMTLEPPYTVVRYFLTADTKEERLQWCYQLNKALAMLRAWGALSSQ